MATTHETEHNGGGHPSLKQYIFIAILLFAITIVEFIIIMDFPGPREKVISNALGQPSTTILLFLLSGIKFAIVILFYMHLKFDNKLFFWTFVGGMTLALMVGLSLIGLFTAIKGGDVRAADAPYTPCYFDHDVGEHGGNVCPDPEPQPTSTPHPVVPTIVYTAPVVVAASASAAADVSGPPNADLGADLALSYGCGACHSTDGSALVGPTWQGLYGTQEALDDGSTVTVDDDYIKESIQDPNVRIVDGFTAGLMPPTLGVKDEEIPHIIEYMKSLK
jgi:cytochrome c551/c552/heme/copper-type cytochrome/quinol oxidase subunit 4